MEEPGKMRSFLKSDQIKKSFLLTDDSAPISFVKCDFKIKDLLAKAVITGLHAFYLAMTNCVTKLLSDIV